MNWNLCPIYIQSKGYSSKDRYSVIGIFTYSLNAIFTIYTMGYSAKDG